MLRGRRHQPECHGGKAIDRWKPPKRNPGVSKAISREARHVPVAGHHRVVLRGGSAKEQRAHPAFQSSDTKLPITGELLQFGSRPSLIARLMHEVADQRLRLHYARVSLRYAPPEVDVLDSSRMLELLAEASYLLDGCSAHRGCAGSRLEATCQH